MLGHALRGLGRDLRAALWPRRSAAYDLDVVDQWLLLTLHRFGPSTFRRLLAEIEAIKGVSPALITESLLKLEGLGLIDRVRSPELMAEEPRFGLLRAARGIVRHIPPSPRSATIFYA